MRFAYEWHDAAGKWLQSYGNENWEFNVEGYMARRIASINDIAILSEERPRSIGHKGNALMAIRR